MNALNQLLFTSAADTSALLGTFQTNSTNGTGDGFSTMLQTKYSGKQSGTDSSSSVPDRTDSADNAATSQTVKDNNSVSADETSGANDSAVQAGDSNPSEVADSEETVVTTEEYVAAVALMGLVQIMPQYVEETVPTTDGGADLELSVPVESAAVMEPVSEVMPTGNLESDAAMEVTAASVRTETAASALSDGTSEETSAVTMVGESQNQAAAEQKPVEYTAVETTAADSQSETGSQTAASWGEGETEVVQTTSEEPTDDSGELNENLGEQLFQVTDNQVVVKVAEPAVASKAPVPLEEPEGVTQLSDQLMAAVQTGSEKVVVTLTPASLGTVSVELTRTTDGALHVLMSASTDRAVNLLSQHADSLQQALAANGRNEVHVEVQRNEEAQEQFLNPDDHREQQQQQRQSRQREQENQQTDVDFLQRLRLGLLETA